MFKLVDLCSPVTKMAQAEAPLSKVPWMANRPPNLRGRPTPEGTQNGHRSVFACSVGVCVMLFSVHGSVL